MLTRKDLDINLSSNRNSGALARVSLRLEANAFADPFLVMTAHSPAELLVHLEEQTIRHVEHKIYGHLYRPICELRDDVLSYTQTYQDYERVREGFRELLKGIEIR
jgi:hypothetical protein